MQWSEFDRKEAEKSIKDIESLNKAIYGAKSRP